MNALIGQLHPLLVHFPVALLVVAALVVVGCRFSPGERSHHALGILSWGAAVGAALSVGAGFVLAGQSFYGGADGVVLDRHAILGYVTAAVAVGVVALRHRSTAGDRRSLAAHLLTLVGAGTVSVCGYLGGELVHGHNHILGALEPEPPVAELASLEPPAGVVGGDAVEPDTLVFRRDVRPMLKRSCFKCHSAKKREGGLRLDTRELALVGGDNGPALVPGDPAASLLIERIQLPMDHEDYMPTKCDPLTEAEVARLVKWVEQGGSYF